MTTTEATGNAIYWVGGSKGGVGKSLVTMASLDHLMERGLKPLLIECDTSNPDVWKAYKEEVPSELVNLDEADGWIQLVNICDGNRENAVVINTAARNNNAVSRFGQTLDTTLGELDRKLVSLWVVNRPSFWSRLPILTVTGTVTRNPKMFSNEFRRAATVMPKTRATASRSTRSLGSWAFRSFV
jgi:hypothetical protein